MLTDPVDVRAATTPAMVERGPLAGVLLAYLASVIAVTVVHGVSAALSSPSWLGLAAGLTLYVVAALLILASGPGAVGIPSTIGAVTAVLAAQAAVWVAAAFDPGTAIGGYTPMLVTAFVPAVMLVLGNRIVAAWIGTLGGTAIAAAVGPAVGMTSWWTPIQTVNLVALAAATAGSLALHHAPAAERVHDGQVAVDQSGDRISRIDHRVRPFLEGLVDTDRVTLADVVTARLLEARLRDGIRAPALDVAQVRDAAWAARERGVWVTLLDDGGLFGLEPEAAESFLAGVVPVLCAELDGAIDCRVIARVAPPGRIPAATVVTASASARRRIEFGPRGQVAKVVHG